MMMLLLRRGVGMEMQERRMDQVCKATELVSVA